MKILEEIAKVLQCLSTTTVLLTAILVIAKELDLISRVFKIFTHGFQFTKTTKVSSRENLSAYGIYIYRYIYIYIYI